MIHTLAQKAKMNDIPRLYILLRREIMRKTVKLAVCLALATSLVACSTNGSQTSTGKTDTAANVLTGKAKGFGGEVIATVTLEDGKIISVEIDGSKETQGIGTKAIEELPGLIVKAGNTEVDVVSGATTTSKAIIAAVNNALDPEKYPFEQEQSQEKVETAPEAVVAAEVFQGFGLSNLNRVGPGSDDKEVPVYSINQVFANVLFDAEGRILDLYIDQLEVATPNYDGETMPHFSGFPGQKGYNMDKDHDGVVDGTSEDTEENFLAEVSSWVTKRERGEGYVMGTGYWATQMDKFQELFVGKTVEEIKEWYAKYCSDINGRPLKADSSKEEDITKYNALTDEEKAMLADVVTGATMSLNDSHGNIIEAIEKAYNNKKGLDITSASYIGSGVNSSGRVGPGKDDKEVPVYSVNQVFANTLFDEEGRIVAINIDQLEYATPNYDGETMPHFSGFPGQEGYNMDSDHDGVVDGVSVPSEESFAAEVTSWATKRDRGEGYVMGTGYWAAQMDKFESIFVGMTVDEVEEWFAKYCSDVNGRPLKADSSNEADVAKFNALSSEEQAMLVDVVASATMSLNDSHGDIIGAIRKSFENKEAIDLTVSK